jgi:hypothetical protein
MVLSNCKCICNGLGYSQPIVVFREALVYRTYRVIKE